MLLLYPLTEEARKSIKGEVIMLDKFPYRIGRQSMSNGEPGPREESDLREPDHSSNNDYYLIDDGRQLNISREHLQVEQKEDGSFEVFDRGSTCGTYFGDQNIGGDNKNARYPIKKGSVVILGTLNSPYVFKFLIICE